MECDAYERVFVFKCLWWNWLFMTEQYSQKKKTSKFFSWRFMNQVQSESNSNRMAQRQRRETMTTDRMNIQTNYEKKKLNPCDFEWSWLKGRNIMKTNRNETKFDNFIIIFLRQKKNDRTNECQKKICENWQIDIIASHWIIAFRIF